ncbi:MAG: hypothetical protein WCI18_17200 [Pseudomonadota bacterium]
MPGLATASLLFGMYSQFLPSGDEGKKLFEVISSFDLSEKSQEALPSVTFMSGESLSDRGNPVLNRVSLMVEGDYDFWLMRQFISPKKDLPSPLPRWQTWVFVGILVDRSKYPAKDYYFEFDPRPGRGNSLPKLNPFRASCSRCHSSGPRVMRPSGRKLFKTQESRRDLMEDWNQKMASYRTVQDFLSNHESQMFPTSEHGSEVLELRQCAECHNSTSDAVRGPLKRKNAESILHLVANHEMPMKDHPSLNVPSDKTTPNSHKRLLKCLKDWTEEKEVLVKGGEIDKKLEECVGSTVPVKRPKKISRQDEGDLVQSTSKIQGKDAEGISLSVKNMNLKANVQLVPWQSLDISGIKMKSVHLTCQKDSECSGVLDLSLAQVSTGIELRDRHLKSWLSRNSALNAKVDLKFKNPFLKLGLKNQEKPSFSLQSQVLIEGGSGAQSETTLTISCKSDSSSGLTKVVEWQCGFDSRATFFKAIEEDRPCFLGVCVSPYVTVSGQFVFIGNFSHPDFISK